MGVWLKKNRSRRLGRTKFYEVFIAPLSRRERVIYGSIILLLVILVGLPRVRAVVSDVGSIVYVPSRNCVATDGWTNPNLASGMPQVDFLSDDPALLTYQNSAINTKPGYSLSCAGFANNQDTRESPAIDISLALTDNPDVLQQSNQQTKASQDYSPARIDARADPIPPNRFAKSTNNLSVDPAVTVYLSKDSGESWVLFHQFDSELSKSQQAHYSLLLPLEYNSDLSKLSVKIEDANSGDGLTLLVDAIGISYKIGQPNKFELVPNINKRTGTLPIIKPGQKSQFKLMSKRGNANIIGGAAKAITSSVGLNPKEPQIKLSARFVHTKSKESFNLPVGLNWQGYDITDTSSWDVDFSLPRSSKPGKYTLEITVIDEAGSSQQLTQDFLWGVLAMNPDQAEYLVDSDASFAFAVLDEAGRTICDANLELEIFLGNKAVDKLSTTGGTISVTDSCERYGNQSEPDYIGAYHFAHAGEYRLELTAITNNGTYSITDNVSVVEQAPFTVSRIGPTRIYPLSLYTMQLEITSYQDFVGTITELVPSSFKISQSVFERSFRQEEVDSDTTKLSWDVSIVAGQKIILGYSMDAPDISPQFYLLGPATFNNTASEQIWSENRQWMIANDALGRMILFYDGATVPAGWTCISCLSTDPAYQRLVRGSDLYGATGGTATHSHTASATVYATGSPPTIISNNVSNQIADNTHTHTLSPAISSASNLPQYRQLKIIRSDVAGEPATLPAGAIAVFDSTVPSGWTRYSAQDSYYIFGEDVPGVTGGSNTHSHSVTGTTSGSSSTNPIKRRGGGSQTSGASEGHIHSISASTNSVNHEPPHLSVILGKLNSSSTVPGEMIAMWDDTLPSGWSMVSDPGSPFYQKFIYGSATYGASGGTTTHTHADLTGITSSGPTGLTNSRIGSTGASSTHTHQVDVTGFSTDNHLPPYIEVIFAKKLQGVAKDLSAYRWYDNTDSADVGPPLASQDTAMVSPAQGTPFRLRLLVHISNSNLAPNTADLKLQYALRSGTCDTGFNGETYVDVGTTGAIHYYNNPTPADADALTLNTNDPNHSTDTIRPQTYEEANNFTNSQSAVNIGEDGMWDFALIDESAPENTSYCFRVVNADGTLLDNYSVIPELTTPNQDGHLILFYDGASAPAGWTCISCLPADDAYQRFLRGAASYGTTGGSLTHSHTATGTVSASSDPAVANNTSGTEVASATHSHNITPTVDPANNSPPYRQLLVIKYNQVGEPATLPAGVIAFFNGTIPSGWTQYSAQNGYYILGESTAGTTGGSPSHNHLVSGTTTPITSTTYRRRGGGTQVGAATATHDHNFTGNTDSQSNDPPYREVVMAKLDSSASVPNNMFGLWDDVLPSGWSHQSNSGDIFYQRFIKAAATAGATGGSETHTHANDNFVSGPPNQTLSTRSGTGGANDTHTHPISVSYSTDSNLPPYLDVIIAKKGINQAPNAPSSLAQLKTDDTTIAVGGWTNETSVKFSALVTDPDNPDLLELCVEVKQVGVNFTNVDDACGTPVSYSGGSVMATVTIGGLTNSNEYHWQARVRDQSGDYSSWVSFGGNAETARDFAIDTVNPSGSVYDGTNTGVDADFNSGSLSTLSANWSISDSLSGIAGYEYSIGTAPGLTDVKGWTNVNLDTSVTDSSLTLNTSQLYFFNVRATDLAGNQAVISSDGQFVAPTLSFAVTPTNLTFTNLSVANSYTDTKSVTLTTSTNAYNGYIVRAYAESLLTSVNGDTIPMFSGGSYAAPDEWLVGDTGYGYTSNDPLVQGVNLFNSTPCLGGGNPPCYAPFALGAPGDIIADHTTNISGSAVVNESFIITHRVTTSAVQPAGTYTTQIIYSVSARY